MTPFTTLPVRVPAPRSAARAPLVVSMAGFLLCVSGLVTGCVGQRFEGEENPASSSELSPTASDSPSVSAAVPGISPSLSGTSEPSPTPSGALSGAAGSASSSSEPAPSGTQAPVPSSSGPAADAGASPPETDSSAGETVSPPCPEWGCPLSECPDSSNVFSPYGVCYFVGRSALRADAVTTCSSQGAGWTLLTIRSEEEHLFVSSELLTTTTWLGASAEMPDQWTWVGDESPFFIGMGKRGTAQDGAFIQWSEGEPSNLVAEARCARYEQDREGVWGWSASNCNRTFEFICELRGD